MAGKLPEVVAIHKAYADSPALLRAVDVAVEATAVETRRETLEEASTLGSSILRRVEVLQKRPHGMACGGTCDTCTELRKLQEVVREHGN